MWKEVNDSMGGQLRNTVVFSLKDVAVIEEPEDEVSWSFHLFFCHKELRRICYFSCSAKNKYRTIQKQAYYDSEEDDEMEIVDDSSREAKDSEEDEEEDDEM
jgi:hypothetical protein